MKPAEFHPEHLSPGEKHTFVLEVDTSAGMIPLVGLLARGAEAGPTLSATAAIHGDEYEGVRTIQETFAELDPAKLRGSFLAVPVANLPAFSNMSRSSPIDGANLARMCPGRTEGSPSEAVAYVLDQAIIAHADFFIDLHSAEVTSLMPTMAGYHRPCKRSRDAGMAFGAPVPEQDSYALMFDSAVRMCMGQEPPFVTTRECRAALNAVFSAYRAAETGTAPTVV